MTLKTPPGRMLFCTSDKCALEGWHNHEWCAGLFSDPDYEGSVIYIAVCRAIKINPTKIIPEINTAQASLGSHEGGIADAEADRIIDMVGSAAGVDWAEWSDLGADKKDQVRWATSSGDIPGEVADAVINRLNSRYPQPGSGFLGALRSVDGGNHHRVVNLRLSSCRCHRLWITEVTAFLKSGIMDPGPTQRNGAAVHQWRSG